MRGMDESVMKKRTSGVNATYMISYSAIKAIELELQQWYEQLPINWRPSPEGPSEVIRYVDMNSVFLSWDVGVA